MKAGKIDIMALVLVIRICFGVPKAVEFFGVTSFSTPTSGVYQTSFRFN